MDVKRANTPSPSLRSHGLVLRRPQHQPGVLPD
jgi:hypothetical protein